MPVPQLPPTPLQPLTPEYSAMQDIQNLDNFFTDILNAQKFAGLIENDTSLARTELEKQVRDSSEIIQTMKFQQIVRTKSLSCSKRPNIIVMLFLLNCTNIIYFLREPLPRILMKNLRSDNNVLPC